MIHAYNDVYLSDARRTLANSLDYAVHTLGYTLEEYYQMFVHSDVAYRFANGDPFYISGRSGIELALLVVEKNTGRYEYKERLYGPGKSKEYWTGWAIAYYQWHCGCDFLRLEKEIPISTVFLMYDKYHEMDINHFVNRMDELRQAVRARSYLKLLREKMGYSQSELSKLTDIPLKTLQHYEQGDKDLSKANVGYVLRLSKVLECDIEEMIKNK